MIGQKRKRQTPCSTMPWVCAGLALALGSACGPGAPVGGSFTATKAFQPEAITAEKISLFFAGESPECDATRLGIAEYNGNVVGFVRRSATDAVALEGFKNYVASLGVEGALDVRCGGTGTTGEGVCQGVLYRCKAPTQ